MNVLPTGHRIVAVVADGQLFDGLFGVELGGGHKPLSLIPSLPASPERVSHTDFKCASIALRKGFGSQLSRNDAGKSGRSSILRIHFRALVSSSLARGLVALILRILFFMFGNL